MKTSSSAKFICCNNELCGSLLCILVGACQSLSLVACQAVSVRPALLWLPMMSLAGRRPDCQVTLTLVVDLACGLPLRQTIESLLLSIACAAKDRVLVFLSCSSSC